MDPDAPWQGSPKAAPGKAVVAEHDAASRSCDGKTETVDAKGRARRSRNNRAHPSRRENGALYMRVTLL
jgi:hypothetical protein